MEQNITKNITNFIGPNALRNAASIGDMAEGWGVKFKSECEEQVGKDDGEE